MKNQSPSVKITAMILAVIVFIFLISLFVYFRANPSQTVDVTGNSQIKVLPDELGIYFNVQTLADTAKEANNENSRIIDNTIAELMKMGIERKDITTQNYNVYPEYDYGEDGRELIGYRATHQLKIELEEKDFDLAGSVIDAGVDAGALISYINFELSFEKQNEYKNKALEEATLNARSKAEGIASGLGRDLGRIVSVSTSDFGYNPWLVYASRGVMEDVALAKEEVANIQPGEQTVTGTVSVVYALK